MTTKPIKTILARALYDNQSEFPTELAFTRGDIVTVLERDPEGYEGWWICSFKGKIGIVPGNRFEVLGTVSKTKTDVASDVYDDPREWSAPEPVTRLHQTIPCAQLFGMGTYENLESRKSGNRISDVTDSGNYSNRSSDVSLSMQSVTGATLTGSTESRMHRKTPDSQFEDYEDLDFDSPRNHKPDFDQLVRALPPMPQSTTTNTRRQIPTVNRRSYGVGDYKQTPWQNDADKLDSDRTSSRCDALMLKSGDTAKTIYTCSDQSRKTKNEAGGENLMGTSSTDLTSTTTNNSTTGVVNAEDLLMALGSRSAYVRFFSPLKQRVEAQCKRVSSAIGSDQPQGLVDVTVCIYNLALLIHDLTIVHQICSVLTTSSKDSPDTGLIRKFLLLRKTAEDLKNQLSETVKNLETKKTTKFRELSRLLAMVSQTVAALDAAVLANSPLLFSPTKILRRANSSSRSRGSNRQLEASRSLSSSVPHLTHLDAAEVAAGLEELQRLNPKQFKAFQDGIHSVKQLCDCSLHIAQAFLGELKAHDWSPSGQKREKTPLTLGFLTSHVKNILHQSSLLVRAITEFCATVCGDVENTALEDKRDYRRKLAMELEHRGSAICEALKGLVIQAKEATNYLRSEYPNKTDSYVTNYVLPMPGPVWQRLLGSTRGVCMNLTAVNKILASYSFQLPK